MSRIYSQRTNARLKLLSSDPLCTLSNEQCQRKCSSDENSGGKLRLFNTKCPLSPICLCMLCTATVDDCKRTCAKEGKVLVHKNLLPGCRCNCACPNVNCFEQCLHQNFSLVNNSLGCPECRCLCRNFDCDALCGIKGLAVVKTDAEGCVQCAGCRESQKKGELFSFDRAGNENLVKPCFSLLFAGAVKFVVIVIPTVCCILLVCVAIFAFRRCHRQEHL